VNPQSLVYIQLKRVICQHFIINLHTRDRWNIWKPRSKGNRRTVFRHHQNARRPVQQHRLHGGMAARILLEGHCAHRRMLWFSLLSLGAEEADRSALASMTWFVLVWVSLAAYNVQRERHGRDIYILHLGHTSILAWRTLLKRLFVAIADMMHHWKGYY